MKLKLIIFVSLLNGCTTNPPIMSKPIIPAISTQKVDTNEVLYKQAVAAYDDEDFAAAFKLFQQAATKNHIKAQIKLASMYYDGKGVDRNSTLSAYWYKQAAKQGDMVAQSFLAALYRFGSGVNKDVNKAVYWYGQSARQGNVEAQLALGMMHYNGTEIAKNVSKAKKLLSLAAQQGNADAKRVLQKIHNQ
ncbi:tetratricopeptide repeat protein [Candidatus Marithrix sp. Canyon 246]|uniref:tetratricopeptide repeat protein n=1 Tax=Candidatus Marithrix sp. Canyon 246 TaxID=1827136 RepID=UPI00084A090D|nr:tetratricopeptide repeat protein [Candidatus Marithrix sp. Canyon 246]